MGMLGVIQLLLGIPNPVCLIIHLLEEAVLYSSPLVIDLMDIHSMRIVERGDGGDGMLGRLPFSNSLIEVRRPCVVPSVPIISSGGEVWVIF